MLVEYGFCLFAADACKDVTCQNGGKCFMGKCMCANSYTGDRCQTPPGVYSCDLYFGDLWSI